VLKPVFVCLFWFVSGHAFGAEIVKFSNSQPELEVLHEVRSILKRTAKEPYDRINHNLPYLMWNNPLSSGETSSTILLRELPTIARRFKVTSLADVRSNTLFVIVAYRIWKQINEGANMDELVRNFMKWDADPIVRLNQELTLQGVLAGLSQLTGLSHLTDRKETKDNGWLYGSMLNAAIEDLVSIQSIAGSPDSLTFYQTSSTVWMFGLLAQTLALADKADANYAELSDLTEHAASKVATSINSQFKHDVRYRRGAFALIKKFLSNHITGDTERASVLFDKVAQPYLDNSGWKARFGEICNNLLFSTYRRQFDEI